MGVARVFVADAAEDDFFRLEKSAPKSDAWRIICLLDGEARPPAKLKSRVFAVLPRDVPCQVLEKTVEKAFESLRAQEEQHHTRQELRRPYRISRRSTKLAWRFPPSAIPIRCWS